MMFDFIERGYEQVTVAMNKNNSHIKIRYAKFVYSNPKTLDSGVFLYYTYNVTGNKHHCFYSLHNPYADDTNSLTRWKLDSLI